MVKFSELKKVIIEFENAFSEYDIIKFSLLHKIIKNILRYKLYSEKSSTFDDENYRLKYEWNVLRAHKFYSKSMDAKSIDLSKKFLEDESKCPNLYKLQNEYAHNHINEVNSISLNEINHVKINFEFLIKNIYDIKKFKIKINPRTNIVNDIDSINYHSESNIMLSGIYKFATPEIQRLISWDENRTNSFLDSFKKGDVNIDIKVFQVDNEINIFDGQHRVLILIFLWYFSTGKINEYKINSKEIKYWKEKFDFRSMGIKSIFNTVKNWYLSNEDVNELICNLKWEVSVFNKKDFAKAFLLYNSSSYFSEKLQSTDKMLDFILNHFNLNLEQVNEFYEKISIYNEISSERQYHYDSFSYYSNELIKLTKNYKYIVVTILTCYLLTNDFQFSNSKNDEIESVMKQLYKWCNFNKDKITEIVKYINWLRFKNDKYHKPTKLLMMLEKYNVEDYDLIKEYLKNEIKKNEINSKEYGYPNTLNDKKFTPFVVEVSIDELNHDRNPFYFDIYIPWLKYYAFIFDKKFWFSSKAKLLKYNDKFIALPLTLINIERKENNFSSGKSITENEKFFKDVPEAVRHIIKENIFYLDEKYYSKLNEEMSICDLDELLKNYYNSLKVKVKNYAK